MKLFTKLLAGTAALALSAGATLAADLPSRRAPAPYVAVPVFTWTGFYVGVNAGYGFSDNNGNGFGFNNFGAGVVPVPGGGLAPAAPLNAGIFGGRNNNGGDGFTGGGQVGYNYQFGAGSGFVIGIEGDIQYADFGGGGRNNGIFGGNGFATANATPNAVGLGIAAPVVGSQGNVALFNNGFGGQNGGDFYGTVRGRLGYAFDRVLVYATGGVAFFDSGNNNGFGFANGGGVGAPFFVSAAAAAAAGGVNGGFRNRNRDDIGYVVGGGVEYAFTNSITARVEGFYIERDGGGRNNGFGGNTVIGVSNTGAPVSAAQFGNRNNNGDSFAVIRAGLNYKFNWF